MKLRWECIKVVLILPVVLISSPGNAWYEVEEDDQQSSQQCTQCSTSDGSYDAAVARLRDQNITFSWYTSYPFATAMYAKLDLVSNGETLESYRNPGRSWGGASDAPETASPIEGKVVTRVRGLPIEIDGDSLYSAIARGERRLELRPDSIRIRVWKYVPQGMLRRPSEDGKLLLFTETVPLQRVLEGKVIGRTDGNSDVFSEKVELNWSLVTHAYDRSALRRSVEWQRYYFP